MINTGGCAARVGCCWALRIRGHCRCRSSIHAATARKSMLSAVKVRLLGRAASSPRCCCCCCCLLPPPAPSCCCRCLQAPCTPWWLPPSKAHTMQPSTEWRGSPRQRLWRCASWQAEAGWGAHCSGSAHSSSGGLTWELRQFQLVNSNVDSNPDHHACQCLEVLRTPHTLLQQHRRSLLDHHPCPSWNHLLACRPAQA